MEVIKVYSIDELSQEFMQSPKVEQRGADCFLMFDFETDTGEYQWTGVTFKDVVEWRITPDSAISEYMVAAYNAVAIVESSEWLMGAYCGKQNSYSHFLVYFDGFGAYEFICTDFIKGVD